MEPISDEPRPYKGYPTTPKSSGDISDSKTMDTKHEHIEISSEACLSRPTAGSGAPETSDGLDVTAESDSLFCNGTPSSVADSGYNSGRTPEKPIRDGTRGSESFHSDTPHENADESTFSDILTEELPFTAEPIQHADFPAKSQPTPKLITSGLLDTSQSIPGYGPQDFYGYEEPDTALSPPPEGNFIKYTNVYTNPDKTHDILFSKSSYEPLSPGGEDPGFGERQPVFEVTTILASLTYYDRFSRPRLKSPPRVQDGATRSILIRSPAIMNALRAVIDYYPGTDLIGSTVRIQEPFRILVHYFDQLRSYGLDSDEMEDRESGKERHIETRAHLDLLLDYVESQVMLDVRAERKRHNRGLVTYKMLWLLFKPGDDVVFVNNLDPLSKGGIIDRDGAVVASVTGGPQNRRRDDWKIQIWYLDFNGLRINRTTTDISIAPFDGEMELAKLEVKPVCSADPVNNTQSLRDYLVEQGRRWFALLKPGCKRHEGEVLDYPFHQVDGLIMADWIAHNEETQQLELSDSNSLKQAIVPPESTYRTPYEPLQGPYEPWDEQYHLDDSRLSAAQESAKFSDYNDIFPEKVGQLTDHQYFLCPQRFPVYFFKSRDWIYVDVRNISPSVWQPKMIDTLVMDERRSNLLKSLAKGFINKELEGGQSRPQHWTADFVKGKGSSQIFLLHGPPGVGKTYTAECIAEYAQRPLMTLTCSDIGTEPLQVEKNLGRKFKLAKKWGAIMLIDEADIYLERRHQTDLARNSLVAGFLRALEVYEGILFLTTNRVGAFDDAFISRIHVKLFYPPLTEGERNKIWKNFMNKLRDERGETMRIMDDAEDYVESKKILELHLNGREIRNIFQTAVGLAEFEEDRDPKRRIKIRKDHLAQVAEMSGEFKVYLDTVLAGDEGARAGRMYLRVDEFRPEEKSSV